MLAGKIFPWLLYEMTHQQMNSDIIQTADTMQFSMTQQIIEQNAGLKLDQGWNLEADLQL